MKKVDIMISAIVFILSIITTTYIAYNTEHPGYNNLFLMPLIYGVAYVLFITPIRARLNNVYIYVFIAVSFTRYVILPLLITLTKYYGGRSSVPPMDSSFQLAIYLMCYEMIVVFLFSYLIFRKYKAPIKNGQINFPKSIFVYVIFIGLSILLSLLFPASLKSFAFLKVHSGFIDFGKGSFLVNLVTYLLVVSKFLIFILILNFCKKRYQKSKNIVYVFISLLAVFINISIFFGDNRADYIITAIASMLLYFKLFPKYVKPSILPLIIIAILVTSFINESRNINSITNGEDKLLDLTETLQVYLAGPYNVAISIEAAELNQDERNILRLPHELLRPVIGLNIILKHFDVKPTSQYFNERIYFSDHVSQIVPMIGQGYFYLGFFLSPLIFILYLILVKVFINLRDKLNRIDLYFFLSIPIARIGFAMGQNASILANDISFFLVLFLIAYYFNNKVVLINK